MQKHLQQIRPGHGMAMLCLCFSPLLLQSCATPLADGGNNPQVVQVVQGESPDAVRVASARAGSAAENSGEAREGDGGRDGGRDRGRERARGNDAEIEWGSFTEEQLFQTIISELETQRRDFDQAGEGYLDLALETRDPAIIQRALQIATVTNDVNAILQLGLLWSEIDPDSTQPHLMLSYQFLETGNLDLALSHMARVLEQGGEIDFTLLASRSGQLDPATRADLIETLQRLTVEFPEQQSVRIALVQLLAENGDHAQALEEFELLEQMTGMEPGLVLLQAQIYQRSGDLDAAQRTLRNGVRRFDADKNLRLAYARMLIQNQKYAAALEQFAGMLEQDPQDWETLFSMALLNMEMEEFADAAEIFTRLLAVGQHIDEASYYLGYAHEQLGNLPRAISHYREVSIGTQNFLSAQQQATRLAIELGELDDAHAHLVRLSRGQSRLEILFNTIEANLLVQAGHTDAASELLETALNKYPNETELLFARVLLHDQRGDMAASERDLRQIILMLPDDSRALNHLGYMLADRTDRFDEALELLERAIAISPDEPAIIDSLGWVQYKLGRYEEALANLRRAFAEFPDHEVASHLGEVLWKMGRRDEANEVWLDALEQTPGSELITEAMQRLQSES